MRRAAAVNSIVCKRRAKRDSTGPQVACNAAMHRTLQRVASTEGRMLYQTYQTHADALARCARWPGTAMPALKLRHRRPDPHDRACASSPPRAKCSRWPRSRIGARISGSQSSQVGERDVRGARGNRPPDAVRHAAAFPQGHAPIRGPRVLIVAPMSGHFATLLRETARTMLADHDVYITDWHNARDVPLMAGRFGLDEYIEHIIDFLRGDGPRRARDGRSASPASPRWPPWRSCPRTITRPRPRA